MLKKETLLRIKNPGAVEKMFINYLNKTGYKVDNSKTIATQVLYDTQQIGGLTNVKFFTENFVSANNNLPGNSFIRPSSEHFIIYAIMVETSDDGNTPLTTNVYNRGLLPFPDLENGTMTIVNNGLVELRECPLTEFDGDSTATNQRAWKQLDQPIIWGGETNLSIALNTANQIPFDQDLSARVTLIGIGLI